MNRSITKLPRLLPFGLGLLLLAACSQQARTPAPSDVRVHAGPHFVQVYWDHPSDDADFEIEQRTLNDGEWTDWAPADALLDPQAHDAMVEAAPGSTHEFRVGVWDNDQIIWTEAGHAVTMGDGVTLQVGTMNRWDGDADAGTAFLVYLDLPEDATGPLELEFQGPPGWAAGVHPRTATEQEFAAGHVLEYLYALPPLPGDYTVTAIDGTGREWSHSLEFTDSDFRLPLATDLTAVPAGDEVAAGWTPPLPGGVTEVVLLEGDLTPFTDYVRLTGSSHTFSGLDLTAAGPELLLEVTASNVSFTSAPQVMPVPYGVSIASTAFATGR